MEGKKKDRKKKEPRLYFWIAPRLTPLLSVGIRNSTVGSTDDVKVSSTKKKKGENGWVWNRPLDV
jgi:hypothetical protein